jgi:hypothetical protein
MYSRSDTFLGIGDGSAAGISEAEMRPYGDLEQIVAYKLMSETNETVA